MVKEKSVSVILLAGGKGKRMGVSHVLFSKAVFICFVFLFKILFCVVFMVLSSILMCSTE